MLRGSVGTRRRHGSYAQDVPGEGDSGSNRHDEPLFPNEVLYHSQPVAWVLGKLSMRRSVRRQGIVDYEPLPAILTIEEAILGEVFTPLRCGWLVAIRP